MFTKGKVIKSFFTTHRLYYAGKCYPGKEIFQRMTLYNTNKSPLRNVFLFKLGWDDESSK